MKLLVLLMTLFCSSDTNLHTDAKAALKCVDGFTDVKYSTLSKIADIESGFNPYAESRVSSARGLFQIIRPTEKHLRVKYGITGNIFDAKVNAMLGALLIEENMESLSKLKVKVNDFSIYLAHFFGPHGAKKLLTTDNNRLGAMIFPIESKYNKFVFYNKYGLPRNIGEIKKLFKKKIERARIL